MKTTALYQNHMNLNAKMTEFAGFQMPLVYSSIKNEHEYVRSHCGIFDVSHMGNIFIEGNDAHHFVNVIFTNRIPKEPSQVTYSLMLNEEGYTIDDVLIYNLTDKKFMVVCNASNIQAVYDWMYTHQKDFDLTIKNESDALSQIAIQGPLSESLLSSLLNEDLSSLTFMTFKYSTSNNHLIISRTGYTGEDGFELYGDHQTISSLFDRSIQVGIYPIGLGARDTLRFEAALPLYGHELSLEIHPYEVGLTFAVKDETFIGSKALALHKQKVKRKLVGIKMLDRGIPRAKYKIYKEDINVGEITTGYMLPGKSYGLAFAFIDKPYHKLQTLLHIDIRGKKIPIQVIKKSFMTKKYKKGD